MTQFRRLYMNKRFLSQMALGLLCIGSFANQMSAMQAPVQQQLSAFCIGCNKVSSELRNLPCEHPICKSCNEQIIDDNTNLGLPGICASCNYVYLTGQVISNLQGHQLNKATFDPVLSNATVKERVLTVLGGIAGVACCEYIDMNPSLMRLCFVGSLASMPLLAGYFKFKKLDIALQAAKNIAQPAPHLSSVIEKRVKAFKTKFGIYALGNALIMPMTIGMGMTIAKLNKNLLENHATAFLNLGLGLHFAGLIALDIWGSKYESIPKIK